MDFQNKLPLFFSVLDLQPYVQELSRPSSQGAQGYPREAILRAFLVSPLERICTFTQLHKRLASDIRFRWQCGFSIDAGIPSVATLSRVFKKIVKKRIAERLFNSLVRECQQEDLIDGSHIAIDSCGIIAYEGKRATSKWDGVNATWGVKCDSFGKKLRWFGYKIHLSVDTYSDLPMAIQVTPANRNDGDVGPEMIEKTVEISSKPIDYVIEDAGYDQVKNYEATNKHGITAIIPLNLRGEKESPEGYSSNGTPKCSMGFEMTYWGADKDVLKFRCPHATGHAECPMGTAWCSSSNYGMVKKVHVKEDIRRFCSPHRDTKRWKQLYDRRSSVERCNAMLKTHLTANRVHVGGIDKVTTHVYLNAIVLLASRLAVTRAVKVQVA
jgi:transposase, IS5 family